jgi:hypothetical protein
MKKPYASDWKVINYAGVQYSESLDRYWYRDRIYDERSANHNGLIGMGAQLKDLIKENNNE